jgi:type III secretory pathway component EscV
LDSDEAVEFGLVDNSVEPAFKKVAMSKSAFEKLGLPVPELKVESDEREPNMTYTIGLEVQGIEEIKDQLKEIQNINERKKDIDATEEKSSPEEPIANNNTNKGATSAERQRQLTLLNFKTKQQDG